MLIDGCPADRVSASDRGLAYGDGLFETVRFIAGRAPLWPRHLQRLSAGCERLGLPPPEPHRLADEAGALVGDQADAVVRITLTRGDGPRGYAPPVLPRPTRIVAVFPAPSSPPPGGLRLWRCRTRLARQPLLAGLKHLNRLEQVLARAEWDAASFDEGLLLDTAGWLVSATAANLFAVIDGQVCTPRLDQCGVAGVARAEILQTIPGVVVRAMRPAELDRASELFLSSGVRGILPVTGIESRTFTPGPVARTLQTHWRVLGWP